MPISTYKHIKIMSNFIKIFKVLGDETRLRLVNLFLQTDEGLCVCEIGDALELPQYQISRHLTILENAGMLQTNRIGTWIYHRIDWESSPFLSDLFKMLSKHIAEVFTEDTKKLKQRLALREEGKCVVGFIPKEELKQLIKNKKEGKL